MEEIVKDGIAVCEDLCPCGSHLRLHACTFGKSSGDPHQKFYIDCESQCGRICGWKPSIDAAIAAFDAEYGTRQVVSNAK